MMQFDQRYQQVETQYNAEHITIQQQPLSLTEKQRKQNRTRMLDRVQAIWIDGVFEPSIQGAAQIALELQHKPSAVVTPLWHVLREFSKTGPLPPADASIVQVYDHASGEVLILGEPGAGKTTLLLELTRDLLERARQDEAHPIPVVFPLSSWATTRQPLTQWLAAELHTRYQVPFPLAASWIETDQVLPLLDGLDEVAAPHRTACVEAINTYRQAHGLLPTVVCSRQTDYLVLFTRLLLRTAVVVQPLTPEQIESYLESGDERLEALRQALQRDAGLQALASTPLMLNVLTTAYQGAPHQEIVATGSPETKQAQIFATYVQRVLTHRSAVTHYTLEQTTHWLSWLARQMKQQNQTVFYIEHLQPDWLSGVRMRQAYDRWAIRFPAILMGILVSIMIYYSLLVPFFNGANPYLALIIVLGGFIGWLLGAESTTQQPHNNGGKARRGFWSRLVARLRVGVLVGLSSALSYALSDPLSSGLSKGLSALSSALSYALSIGRSYALSDALGEALSYTLSVGLSVGLGVWLLLGLFQGVSSETIRDQHRVVPNQGIHRSARNCLVLGLISTGIVLLVFTLSSALSIALSSALSYGLSIGLSDGLDGLISVLGDGLSIGLSDGLSDALSIGLIIGLSAGLLAGLLNGGLACLRHSVVRLLLWRAGSIPWNYPRFLDSATEQILLRKVGGGYIFVHRLLLDYFANLENGTDSDATVEDKQERLPPDTMPSASVEPTGVDEPLELPTTPLAPTPVLPEALRLLSCGHELRTPNARFCSVCGAPIRSSSLE